MGDPLYPAKGCGKFGGILLKHTGIAGRIVEVCFMFL
jgi:hypothetical protein